MRPSTFSSGLLLWLAGMSGGALAADRILPHADFVDRREPPPYRTLSPVERDAFELGHVVFNTQWVPAGTPRAERRDGLGPAFNAASCDACHNNGARGLGATGSGALPVGLVIQLSNAGGADPRYGHVLNPAAIEGFVPEGSVRVVYEERAGRYPDGQAWRLRVPHCELSHLSGGPLAASTVIKPRLAQPLFGVGLLDAVPETALEKLARTARPDARGTLAPANRVGRIGRFGWQGDSHSLAEQTARALSREMGLRSRLIPEDDCKTPVEKCRTAVVGGVPEVSDEFFAALMAFQTLLAVPRANVEAIANPKAASLFESIGCAECHVSELPVQGVADLSRIQPYTDLLLHDMGADLADRDAAGRVINSRWRTAPLWAVAYTGRDRGSLFLLHDGRARSIEEAVLWHGGEAAAACDRFTSLEPELRQALVEWVSSR